MTMSSTTKPRTVTYSDLEQYELTAEQLSRLDQLRASYPYLEFTNSIDEWRRLNFLKWRHATGRVSEQ